MHDAPPKKYVLTDLSKEDLETLDNGLCWLIGECMKGDEEIENQCIDLRNKICELLKEK